MKVQNDTISKNLKIYNNNIDSKELANEKP